MKYLETPNNSTSQQNTTICTDYPGISTHMENSLGQAELQKWADWLDRALDAVVSCVLEHLPPSPNSHPTHTYSAHIPKAYPGHEASSFTGTPINLQHDLLPMYHSVETYVCIVLLSYNLSKTKRNKKRAL